MDKPNEAAHRLHAVDRFLREVLEWPAKSVYPEEYTLEGRIDYFLKTDGVAKLLSKQKAGTPYGFPWSTPQGRLTD
jgi:predicted type IV restriction endonuclease